MTFLELQNEVLSDRFGSDKRPNAKNWLNYRYGRLWGMEPWTFKLAVSDIAVNLNASTYTLASGVRVIGLWDSTNTNFDVTSPIRPEDFYELASETSGTPYNWTVVGNNIIFDRPMGQNRTFKLLSEVVFTPLSADGDIPAIPSEFHLVLASGAASHGLRLENDPSWESFEDDWQRGIADMKANYLTKVVTFGDTYPSWP